MCQPRVICPYSGNTPFVHRRSEVLLTMMNPQHRQPLAAFGVLVCVAALAIGNDLRKSAVETLIERAAPQVLVEALAPDMVIGDSLHSRSAGSDQAQAGDFASSPGVGAPEPYTLPNLFDDKLPPLPALSPSVALTHRSNGTAKTSTHVTAKTSKSGGSSTLGGGVSAPLAPTTSRTPKPPRSSVTVGSSAPTAAPSTGGTLVQEDDQVVDPGRGKGHQKDGRGHSHHGTTKPEKVKSVKVKSEKTKSDKTKSDHGKSDKTKWDHGKSDHGKSDKNKSDKAKPDKNKSDKTKSGKSKTEKSKADKGKSKSDRGKSGKPGKGDHHSSR